MTGARRLSSIEEQVTMATHEIPELDREGLRQFGLTTGGIVAVLFGVVLPWLFDLD